MPNRHLTHRQRLLGTALVSTVLALPTSALAAPIHATAGNDTLTGSDGRDRIRAGAGDDQVDGRGGADVIFAQLGVDTIFGGDGDDRLFARARGDVQGDADLAGDRVSGGAGRDRIHVRDGERDVVECGPGRDVVIADYKDQVTRDCDVVGRRAPRA